LKKLALGCLIILAVAVAGFGAAIYWGYRAARPMIQSAGEYVTRARDIAAMSDEVKIKTPFDPPTDGSLTDAQVDRFFAVQGSVKGRLGEEWDQLSATAAATKKHLDDHSSTLSFREFADLVTGAAGVYLDARRAQVIALNTQKFSESEYAWVRRRIYEAGGIQLAGTIDMSALERAIREGSNAGGVRVPAIPLPEVPQKNLDLVKPHIQALKDLMPLAILGL